MKRILLILFVFAALCESANAGHKQISYLEEMYTLGSVSGQGLACKSKKYHQYELLARAILVGKAQNGAVQRQGMEKYTAGKVEAFAEIEDSNFAECQEILEAFDKQKIFQSTLYSDGRIMLYDGTMITPRKAYNAAKLYQKDREAFIKADAAYKKASAEAKKNMQNAKKIPLHDSNYERYAKEFN